MKGKAAAESGSQPPMRARCVQQTVTALPEIRIGCCAMVSGRPFERVRLAAAARHDEPRSERTRRATEVLVTAMRSSMGAECMHSPPQQEGNSGRAADGAKRPSVRRVLQRSQAPSHCSLRATPTKSSDRDDCECALAPSLIGSALGRLPAPVSTRRPAGPVGRPLLLSSAGAMSHRHHHPRHSPTHSRYEEKEEEQYEQQQQGE